MTDNSNPADQPTASPLTARVWLWHTFPDGTFSKIEIPIPLFRIGSSSIDADDLKEALNRLQAAGFTANAPGTIAGTMVEEVNQLVIGKKSNKHGTGYVVAYYPVNTAMVYRAYGKQYLDTPEQEAEFERVTGLKLADLTIHWAWDAKNGACPKRDDPDAARYFYTIKTPIKVGFVPNPEYNPDEKDVTKKKSQYDFSTYVGTTPNANSKPQTAAGQPSGQPASSVSGDTDNGESPDVFGKLVDGIFGNREHGRQAFKKLMDMKIINKKTMSQDKQLIILDAYHQLRETGALAKNAEALEINGAIMSYIEKKRAAVATVEPETDVDFTN